MEETCHVCGKPLDEICAVNCVVCGGKVHFNPAGSPGNDCCGVVTQIGACGLSFVCNDCDEKIKSRER